MNKLNDYLDEYAKSHSLNARRELIDSIMEIPRNVEQQAKISSTNLWLNIRDWGLFLVPRLSGLTAACVLGLYMGSAGGAALAEDELARDLLDQEQSEVVALLDVEEFIFAEDIE